MPWADELVTSFDKLPHNLSEACFHGPYIKLLFDLFLLKSPYIVTLGYMPHLHQAVNIIVWYEVKGGDRPILIVELKWHSTLQFI